VPEESIYELLPQQQPVMDKPPMYKSKVSCSAAVCSSNGVVTCPGPCHDTHDDRISHELEFTSFAAPWRALCAGVQQQACATSSNHGQASGKARQSIHDLCTTHELHRTRITTPACWVICRASTQTTHQRSCTSMPRSQSCLNVRLLHRPACCGFADNDRIEKMSIIC